MSVRVLFTACFAVNTLLALSLPFKPSLPAASGIQDGLCPVGRTSSGSTNTWKMASRKSYRCSTRSTPPPHQSLPLLCTPHPMHYPSWVLLTTLGCCSR